MLNKYSKYSYAIIILTIGLLLSSGIAFGAENNVSLEIGDIVELGSYNDIAISWQVINIDESANPMLITNRAIMVKAFDASGSKYPEDDFYSFEKYYGRGDWSASTLRQWLNSDKGKVNWEYNTPNEENIFNGENSYAQENGFLSTRFFDKREKDLILKKDYSISNGKKSNDFVTIPSFEDIESLDLIKALPNAFTLTIQAKNNIDAPSNIWFNKGYVLLRDAEEAAPHLVSVANIEGKKSNAVASSARTHVSLIMHLDASKLARLTGDGTSSSPFKIEGAATKEPTSNNYLWLIIGLFIIVIILIALIFNKRRIALNKKLLSIGILTALILLNSANATASNEISNGDKLKVITLGYAKDLKLIEKRVEQIYENENNNLIILDSEGNIVTKEIKEKYKQEDFVNFEELTDILLQEGYIIVRKGDYRITTLKREVSAYLRGERDIYFDVSYNGDLSKEEINQQILLYSSENDYEKIESFLQDNNILIMHKYDGDNGIGVLHWQSW